MIKRPGLFFQSVIIVFISAVVLWFTGCSVKGCGTAGSGITPAVDNANYIILAWNDLGMHCLNGTYDNGVILPPYNTLWAQVIKRGVKPEIITGDVSLRYRILNNTRSYGKKNAKTGADYGQFWDNAKTLFGAVLERDTGLNLEDPQTHNGLQGNMVAMTDHFQANGIPLTPVDDSGTWNPFQVAEISLYDADNKLLAMTRTTIPTSDEINCGKCHNDVKPVMLDVLRKHDEKVKKVNLEKGKPKLCAECHGSPALGMKGRGSANTYLSEAIHGFHADKGALCYDCHPGPVTRCNRSISHTADDGNCIKCHGDLKTMADSIKKGRVPWMEEPACSDCHKDIVQVDTKSVLYRNAGTGHGNLYCPACHGSPHAMTPSSKETDNYQALQYQGKAMSLGSCGVCHDDSRGKGNAGFIKKHGEASVAFSACNVCHTQVISGKIKQWPHEFMWKARMKKEVKMK